MSKPLFIIKRGVAREVAMVEIDKLCQEKGVTDFDVMTEEEFDTICDELGLTYTWSPFINRKTIGTMHFAINDTFHFRFIIDWESKDISISWDLCDKLHIGRDKEGVYELTIANVEELLHSIASFKAIYKPVLTNKL